MIPQEIKNALVNSGSSLPLFSKEPKQFADRQYEYLNPETRLFINEIAKYSGDFVEAEVQGLNCDEPYEYTTVHLRFSNVVKPSGALSNEFDNYKYVLIAEKQYSYLRRGAKIKAMGNTWLVVNPQNMSEGGTAVIQRCDAVWNYIDYYGNVHSEPLAIDKLLKRASTPDSQRSTMITKGYFNARAQYNEATKQLFENSRIILGSGAYILTGFSDFQREFTDEEDSVNLMEFALRVEEPNHAIDDMKNHVAGGKTFSWDISVGGTSTILEGETVQLTATSIRSNVGTTETVVSTDEYPIDYIWESSDEDIAEVDAFGNVEAISEGEATITVRLAQNENIYQEFNIAVATVDTEPHVSFMNTYPERLPYNRSVRFEAKYYENGEATDEIVTWTVTGADEEAYTFVISESNGNIATLKCWGGSVTPAVVTAEHDGHSVSHTIYLEGI